MNMVLNDVCEVYSGYALKSFNEVKEGFPVIKIGNILTDGRLSLEDCQYTTETVNTKYYSQKDDVYVALSGATTGKIGLMETDESYVINQRVGVVRRKDKKIPSRFIKYFLLKQTERILQEAAGCAQPNISPKQIGAYTFPSFSSEKMEEITRELDKVTNVIQYRYKQNNLLDCLIKARFVEMFGDVNANDRKWPIKPLGELCNIVRGASPRPIEKFLGGTVPWIKIGDATENESVYLNSTKEHIIENGVKKSRLVKSGSLIFANCGVSLGFARIITFDGCIHDGWLAMEDIDQKLDKVFLLHTLNQVTEHFRKVAPAGTQPNLNTAIMKSYKQILPPLELQRTFIEFAKQVDKSKVAIQKSLAETQLLFDKLMQDYFG